MLSVASGIIFFFRKNKENTFIFSSFLIYSFTIIMNVYFGYKIEINPETNVTTQVAGLLSANQSLLLEIIATLLLTIGFGIKAYATVKKT